MFRHIESEQFLLPVQLLLAGHRCLLQFERGHGRVHFVAEQVEHRGLAGFAQALFALSERYDALQVGKQRRAATERGQRSGFGETLERALIHGLQVDPAAEILQRFERAVVVALLNDALRGAGADVLDLAQAKTDRFAVLTPLQRERRAA